MKKGENMSQTNIQAAIYPTDFNDKSIKNMATRHSTTVYATVNNPVRHKYEKKPGGVGSGINLGGAKSGRNLYDPPPLTRVTPLLSV